MRPADGSSTDSAILASLEAVDATLAGDPVDPAHADLAELALLLAAERPTMATGFAAGLDRAVQRRFVRAESGPSGRSARIIPALRRRWWFWTPAAGLTLALAAAVVIVAGGGNSQAPVPMAANSSEKLASPSASSAPAHQPSASGASAPQRTPGAPSPPRTSFNDAAASGASAYQPVNPAAAPTSASGGSLAVQAPAGGRKAIRGAQLALNTAPSRLETVAQEVFTVVGQVQGVVESSTVTATNGPGGYAQFQLSIPSSALSQAMASLSTLHYARVASRTDTTQDVNNQYEADVRALADARALRTSLLKQLANAISQAQIDSLTARIHDAEASISSDEATLRGLTHQINYSQVSLTINGGIVPVRAARSHGGFGVGQAAHDAGRVLTVAAGIGLIGAAALAPLALLAALAWWVAAALRRRRREQALDLV